MNRAFKFMLCFSCVCHILVLNINGQTGQDPVLRVSNFQFEPIQFVAGPAIEDGTFAYLTFEMEPDEELMFLNARLSDPATGTSIWLVRNVPLPPFNEPQTISYPVSVEAFGNNYTSIHCAYNVGIEWQENEFFPATGNVDLIPEATTFNIPSGSDDPSIDIGQLSYHIPPGGTPKLFEFIYRGCDVPNVDLDNSKQDPKVPNDHNACGPAAAANSLHWLVRQHDELAGETSSLRSKVDSLKKYMNLSKTDTNGVRFDSMVVGKLTLIDKLKLPISVKYQTKHESGNVKEPLASTEKPNHTSTNHGKLGVYPDFDWMKKEMEAGEDVEIHVGWYGPGVDGALTRYGGHWVVATGYFSSGMTKGVFIKEDDDQSKKGGLRHKYYEWAPGEVPYLIGLTDAKGNVAIVESVVSESYDPAVTLDDAVNTPVDPWEKISLTGLRMKPFYAFMPELEKGFPWLPVIGGVVGAGTAAYFLTKENDDCDFSVTTQFTPSTCGLANGSAAVIVSPAGDYEYEWSNGAMTSSIEDVPGGNYTVTVRKAGTDCQTFAAVPVINLNPDFHATFITQDAECGTSTGSVITQVTPAGFYTYTWSNGGSGAMQSNLAPGDYSVTISAGGTCIEEYSVSIAELDPTFELNVTTTPSACGQATGSGSVTVSPPGNYMFEWSNGSTGPQTDMLSSGSYQVTVTLVGTQCAKTISAEVGEVPAEFEITVSTTPSECEQATGSGTLSVTPSGSYTFEWSNGSTGQQVTSLAAGTYMITVTLTGTQCAKTISLDIGELPPSFNAHAITTPSECAQATGTGSIIVNPPAAYIYEWSNGSTGQQVMDLPAGVYSITVTLSGTHCSKIISAEVLEHLPTFDVTVITTPSGCTDSTGTATLTVDPVDEYTYEWSNGLTGSQVTGLQSGEYVVTITIAGTSCSKTISVTIGQEGVMFTGMLTTEDASCGIADGSATITIEPPGAYSYLWSNQQTGNVAQQLITGNYSVTVTDENGCTAVFSGPVEEEAAEYITVTDSVPGFCVGGGEILFTLTTPGQGQLVVNITSHGEVFNLDSGMYALSDLMLVSAGNYVIQVYDQSIGKACQEIVNVHLPDVSPAPVAVDDLFFTTINQSVSENALGNDTGLSLQMISVMDITGGTVTFGSDGQFTFIPDPGFIGEASFIYTIKDTCGVEASAVVTIIVEEFPCSITIDVMTTPASCGLEDGEIIVDVIEPGMYTYEWSNGDTGPQITNVFAGTYTVTITDESISCSQEFTIELPESPPDYISDVEITQPSCTESGDISFIADAPGMNQLEMNVEHPNGSDAFFIDEGLVVLSDYLSITPGNYVVEVSVPGAGSDCVESFAATIDPVTSIEIAEEAVIPPSSPTGMDGTAIIVITVPGESPYTIFLDGMFYGVTTETTIFIEGLGVGEYVVQIQDAAGCFSNELIIIVPLPDIIVSFGGGITNYEVITSPEKTEAEPMWSTCLVASVDYFIAGRRQEVEVKYATGLANRMHDSITGSVLSIAHLTEIGRWKWDETYMQVQAGVALEYLAPGSLFLSDSKHWLIRVGAKRRIGELVDIKGSFSINGWRRVERVGFDVSVRKLFQTTSIAFK